jgi:hypothetical protein
MSGFRHADIFVELNELCHDLMNDIRQQLAYYRVSVYKTETGAIITKKIEQLRLVTSLFADPELSEPIKDYDAMVAAGISAYVPGECSLSNRVTCLLQSLEGHLEQFTSQLRTGTPETLQLVPPRELAKSVQKHRRQLLALCRHGSRQWAFFQSL